MDMTTFDVNGKQCVALVRKRDYSSITKPDPEKYCAFCGERMHRQRFKSGRLEDLSAFMRRKYCCRKCMRKGFTKSGKDTKQSDRCAHTSSHRIAYFIMGKIKKCEFCGKTEGMIDVHHKDGVYTNNTETNLIVLCRKCHMRLHRYGITRI